MRAREAVGRLLGDGASHALALDGQPQLVVRLHERVDHVAGEGDFEAEGAERRVLLALRRRSTGARREGVDLVLDVLRRGDTERDDAADFAEAGRIAEIDLHLQARIERGEDLHRVVGRAAGVEDAGAGVEDRSDRADDHSRVGLPDDARVVGADAVRIVRRAGQRLLGRREDTARRVAVVVPPLVDAAEVDDDHPAVA